MNEPIRAWAIKNPKGNINALTTSEDELFAWRRKFSLFGGKSDWRGLRNCMKTAQQSGWKAVRVEIREIEQQERGSE